MRGTTFLRQFLRTLFIQLRQIGRGIQHLFAWRESAATPERPSAGASEETSPDVGAEIDSPMQSIARPQGGPPPHWLDLVRKSAPGLLQPASELEVPVARNRPKQPLVQPAALRTVSTDEFQTDPQLGTEVIASVPTSIQTSMPPDYFGLGVGVWYVQPGVSELDSAAHRAAAEIPKYHATSELPGPAAAGSQKSPRETQHPSKPSPSLAAESVVFHKSLVSAVSPTAITHIETIVAGSESGCAAATFDTPLATSIQAVSQRVEPAREPEKQIALAARMENRTALDQRPSEGHALEEPESYFRGDALSTSFAPPFHEYEITTPFRQSSPTPAKLVRVQAAQLAVPVPAAHSIEPQIIRSIDPNSGSARWPSASPAPFPDTEMGAPWPNLPEFPSEADELAQLWEALRDRDQYRRLDCEQKGMLWNA